MASLFLPIGLWAGFIVLDSATYMPLGLVVGVGDDLIRANAIKSLFILWLSPASLLVFDLEAEIDWRVGLLLSVGRIVGSWVGGLFVTKEWTRVGVRLLAVVILVDCQLPHRFGLLHFGPRWKLLRCPAALRALARRWQWLAFVSPERRTAW